MWLTICDADDSGSMKFEDNGQRIKELHVTLQRVTYAAMLFDEDGISARFMNGNPKSRLINNINNDTQINELVGSVDFRGLTPMGTSLRNKVIDPLVVGKQLRKPVLVVVLTDGKPSGEADNALFETIQYTHAQLSRSPYGPGAVAFQIAQIGNDQDAMSFLASVDKHPGIGHLVDCTSSKLLRPVA